MSKATKFTQEEKTETFINEIADGIKNIQIEEKPKPYTFRKLIAEDIFPLATIIHKIGLKEFTAFFEGGEYKNILKTFTGSEKDESATTALGISIFIELANVLVCNLPKCQNELFALLANVSNLDEKEVRQLGIADFAEMVIDFLKKEEFMDFFKVASKLFK